VAAWLGSELLQRIRSAPVRARCFGPRRAWQGDKLLQIPGIELPVILAAHPITGVQAEALAERRSS